MERPLQCCEPRRARGVDVSERRGYDPDGERRGVEVVVDVENEHALEAPGLECRRLLSRQHVEEVLTKAERGVRFRDFHPLDYSVAVGYEGRHLCDDRQLLLLRGDSAL